MEPWKANRIFNLRWNPPVLEFSIERHPLWGENVQRWGYDFETNEARVISRWVPPKNPPYHAERDATEIVNAIVKDTPHICVQKLEQLWVINPRKLPKIKYEPFAIPKQTVDGKVKRLKSKIRELMQHYAEFEETRYRGMLAYKWKQSSD